MAQPAGPERKLRKLADAVSPQLQLSKPELTLDLIAESQTFREGEKALCSAVTATLLSAPTDELVTIAQNRQSSFWSECLPDVQAQWALIAVAGQLLLEATRLEGEIKTRTMSGSAWVGAYTSGERPWCSLDTHHRHLERRYHNFDFQSGDDDEQLTLLVARARHRYMEIGGMLSAVINGDYSPGLVDYTQPGTPIRLFATSEGAFLAEIDNQTVVTQLVLPDGRALNFNYNQFGEVAEILLPTGASIQYDYAAATLPAGNTTLQENHSQMGAVSNTDRAVVTRRTYQPGSTTPEGTWTYSYGSLTPSNSMVSAPATEVTCTSGGQLLLHERHFFLHSGRYISGTNTGMKDTYDSNSNLKTRTDSRIPAVTTTYQYDALNRVIGRTYSDNNTPPVTYKYDAQTLPSGAPGSSLFDRGYSTGRLVAVLYGGTTAGTYTGYDRFGRANVSVQQTDSQNYAFTYAYNLASEMTTETFPSGRVITTTYDVAGRVLQLSGAKTGEQSKTYASQFSYAAHGAAAALQLGNGKWEHTNFNNRLQPIQIGLGVLATDSSLLELDYKYGMLVNNVLDTTKNNGNIQSRTYHPFDNASALTKKIKDPELHFANNKSNNPDFGPNYFFAHWDRASVNSLEGGPIGDAAAGISHSKGLASPQAVRDYLKKTEQYPQ